MGLILKSAVENFLNRERRDVRPIKDASLAELHAMKEALPVKPPIWKKLKRHQRACFLLGVEHRNFGFHLDTGMGKTLLGIAISRYFDKLGKLTGKRVLVLMPNKINKAEWAREMRKWGQRGNYVVLTGTSKEKWQQLRGDPLSLFVIETYAGFVRMLCKPVPKRKGRGQRLKPDAKLVREMQTMIGGLILDESTNVASRDALATRIAKQLKKTSEFLLEMTGTPFGRDPTMLHSQLSLIDDGYSLGETLGLYRAAFFTEHKNYWGGFEYKFRKDMEETLNRFLAHSTIRYEVEQSDLPSYIPVTKEVSLPDDAELYADKALAALRAAKGNYRETQNAFLRMRQISSGWIGYDDDDAGKKAQLEFSHNPKLDMLLSLLESLDHKAIVFHEYIFTGDMLERALTKDGIAWARISGKTTQHDRILRDFSRANGPQVLILQNAMSFGPNLQAAKYGFWFESPCSPIIRKQGRRRFERQHSEHKKVFGIDLVTRGTYDSRILAALADGEDLFQKIIEGRAKL